jgi:nitrogen fixation NifU-like protein
MLDDLYQELILDHGKKPRNFGDLPGATHQAEGYNPFCGDQVHVRLILSEGRIEAIQFEGCGCAISTASGSMMTEAVKGKSVEEAQRLFSRFRQAVTCQEEADDEALGQLICLAGVKQYPNRIKCATLAWHALDQALKGEEAQVSTEEPR